MPRTPYIEMHAVLTSDSINTRTIQLYDRDNTLIIPSYSLSAGEFLPVFDNYGWVDRSTITNRRLGTYNLNTENGKRLIRILLGNDYNLITDALLDMGIADVYANALMQFKLNGLNVAKKRLFLQKSKSGKRVKDFISKILTIEDGVIPKPSYKVAKNVLKDYRVYGVNINNINDIEKCIKKSVKCDINYNLNVQLKDIDDIDKHFNTINNMFGIGDNIYTNVKKIPYPNYDLNNGPVGVNCFYWLIINKYNRISPKVLKKYNRSDGVILDDIIEFCNKYKIGCKLLNIAGRTIYTNNLPTNKNHTKLEAIISNNHIYPLLDPTRSNKPEKCDNKLDDDYMFTKNDIVMEINNKQYSRDGLHYPDEYDDIDIDNVLFKGLYFNFSYKYDLNKIVAFNYSDRKINKLTFEYDMKTCYYTVAYELIPNSKYIHYPLFSCTDFWERYDKKEEVSDVCYYTINEDALKRLHVYGLYENMRIGYMINYLLDEKLLKKNEIEFVKKPSLINQDKKTGYRTGRWDCILDRLDKLFYNLTKKELGDEFDEELSKTSIKNKKMFSVYNGLLGKEINSKTTTIHNLPENEYDLLNHNCKEEVWERVGNGDQCFYKKNIKSTYKYFNNVTIYNHIVEYSNFIILKNIVDINKKYGIMPLKVKTDAIGYNREVDLQHHCDKFKLVTTEKYINKQNLEVKNENGYKHPRSRPKYVCIESKLTSVKNNELDKIEGNKAISGPPGVGKSYYLTEKEDENYKYHYCATTTNLCKINMISNVNDVLPVTIYSLFMMHTPEKWYQALEKLRNKVLWIDEYSMVNSKAMNFLMLAVLQYNTKIIFTGDISQLAPIGEYPLDLNNYAITKLFGDHVYYTKNYRCDEQIQLVLKETKKQTEIKRKLKYHDAWVQYKKKDNSLHLLYHKLNEKDINSWLDYDRHLVLSADMANFINKKLLEHNNYTFKQITKPVDNIEVFKELDVSIGVIIISTKNEKRLNIFKNAQFKVIGKQGDVYELQNILQKKDKNGNDIPNIYIHSGDMINFRPGFAVTTYSAQGVTITDDMCIHEIDTMIYWDPSIIYTALSRGREMKKIHMYYRPGKGSEFEGYKKSHKRDNYMYCNYSPDEEEEEEYLQETVVY